MGFSGSRKNGIVPLFGCCNLEFTGCVDYGKSGMSIMVVLEKCGVSCLKECDFKEDIEETLYYVQKMVPSRGGKNYPYP